MMQLELKSKSRTGIFNEVQQYIESLGLTIVSSDVERPWGAFFVIDEAQAKQFAELFFTNTSAIANSLSIKLSPKVLVVEPGKRLSWQYHSRRAEIWQTISGTVSVATSLTNDESKNTILSSGEGISLAQGERHRLIGLSDWGVVAEIWQHTDPDFPSDESDIVRLQDDFGR
jgi:mannose-6-phosphate isomerase-like protein (cupin superfamily)